MESNYDYIGNLYEDEYGVAIYTHDIDSIKKVDTRLDYNSHGQLVQSVSQEWNEDYTRIRRQNDMNRFGVICRAGGISGARYYSAEVVYTPLVGISSLAAKDEFNEPDYVCCDNGELYYYKRFVREGYGINYDENNEEIEDADSLRNALPKVMTIEVTDSAAYARGLRDNDVILLYGDYSANLDSIVTLRNFRIDWTLRSVLDARKNKRMVVFRIEDAAKNKYGLVEIGNLEGTPSELGFLAHIRYLTKKQRARIQKAIEDNISSASPLLTKQDLHKTNNKGGDNYVIMAFPEMFREYRQYPYPKQVTDPTILLSACHKGLNIKWSCDNEANTDNFATILNTRKSSASKYPVLHFFYTKDANSINSLVLTEQYPCTRWLGAYISDKDYDQLSSLYAQAKDSVEHICANAAASQKKDFVGYWEINSTDNDKQSTTGYLNLSENGEIDGEISYYYYKEYKEYKGYCFVYNKTKTYVGKWSNDDNWIYLPQCNDSLLYVDFLTSEEVANQYFTIDSGLGNAIYIDSVGSNYFITSDSIVFVKREEPQYNIVWSEEQKDSIYNQALTLWRADNNILAHHLFLQLAKANYAESYFYLAQDYLNGYGVEKDIVQAEKWDKLCRKDSEYGVTYKIAKRYVNANNHKKAKEYIGYLKKGEKYRQYNELAGRYFLQNGDTLKALKYLNDYSYYLLAEDDSAEIVRLWNEYRNAYFPRYPKQAADGMAHLAHNIQDMGYPRDAIETYDEAYAIKGNLKTKNIDYKNFYYQILRYMAIKHPEDYGAKFNDYMEDKCFRIKWKKDNPATLATGIKDECFIIAYNDWNITNTLYVFGERAPGNSEDKERHILLYHKGRVVHYDFTGPDDFEISIESVDRAKKQLLVEAFKREQESSTTEQ